MIKFFIIINIRIHLPDQVSDPSQLTFALEAAGSTVHLKADTTEDRDKWIQGLINQSINQSILLFYFFF